MAPSYQSKLEKPAQTRLPLHTVLSPPPGALAEALRAAGQGAESGAVLLPWLASLPHRDSVQMCGAPARDPVDSRPLLPPVPLGTWSPDSVRAVS